jgi:hypothetical protein
MRTLPSVLVVPSIKPEAVRTGSAARRDTQVNKNTKLRATRFIRKHPIIRFDHSPVCPALILPCGTS